MSSVIAALAVAAGLSHPLPWGFNAHRAICEIAWRELTPRAQSGIQALLTLDPEYTTFPDACTWADPASRTPAYARYRTAHYVNVVPGAPAVSIERDCVESICVLEALEEFGDVLRDRTLSPNEHLVAIKFLSHFVGDLHQPLHVAYEADRGGNSRQVSLDGRTYNLHEVWDRLLFEHGDQWSRRAEELHTAIDPIDRTVWGSDDPLDWANESFSLVVSDVYADLAGDSITDEYLVLHRRTAATRIAQAGFRLGALLNALLNPEA